MKVARTFNSSLRITVDVHISNQISNQCIVMEYMAHGNLRKFVQTGIGSQWAPGDMLFALLSIR